MIKLLTDQNFNGRILRGLVAQIPDLDVVRTEDIGLKQFKDFDLLSWAAEHDRVILTHDERTFYSYVSEKMMNGEKMTGVIVVPDQTPIGKAIDDLVVAIECKFDDEWENNVTRIPI